MLKCLTILLDGVNENPKVVVNDASKLFIQLTVFETPEEKEINYKYQREKNFNM